jgi:hypothetical protein
MTDLQELKKEADDLGITYNKNIGLTKLQEKVETFYSQKETSGPALVAKVEKIEQEDAEDLSVLTDKQRIQRKRMVREKAARETRVVTIIDNDQRVNNQTTTCVVNCSSEYADLGTVVLPLNEKIEVKMGHIRNLEDVRIPLHVRDQKTGLSTVRLRPRYSVSYENS